MKRRWLLTALGAILAGAGLHFLWQALPNPLFALISPVNESVWEHLKLLYWPMLAAALVLAGVSAEGETRVHNIAHIDRGYENYACKLSALGADVVRAAADDALPAC